MAFSKKGLQQLKPSQLVLRFCYGGAVCVMASVVDSKYGPLLGGLFLAFPAAVPAILSIALRHQTPRDALEIAYGSSAGALGLFGVGIFLWQFGADLTPLKALASSLLLWLAIATSIWKLVFAGGPSDNAED